MLFWYLLPSLLRNSGNKCQNNPLVSAENVLSLEYIHTGILIINTVTYLIYAVCCYETKQLLKFQTVTEENICFYSLGCNCVIHINDFTIEQHSNLIISPQRFKINPVEIADA